MVTSTAIVYHQSTQSAFGLVVFSKRVTGVQVLSKAGAKSIHTASISTRVQGRSRECQLQKSCGGPTTEQFRNRREPKWFKHFLAGAQIAVLTVPRQQAHHKLSFGITFSPQLSTSGSGRPIQTMLFRQKMLFRQSIFGTFFFVTPK